MSKIKNKIWLIYIFIVFLISLPFIYRGLSNTFVYFTSLENDILRFELFDIILLIVICGLCYSLPVYIRENEALDLSIIPMVTTLILKGVWVAFAVLLIGYLFAIEQPRNKNDKRVHLFNRNILKTLFNIANLIISLYCGWLVYRLLGGVQGLLVFPDCLIPIIGFFVVCFFVSAIVNSILMRLLGNYNVSVVHIVRDILISVFPNLLATAPISVLFVLVFQADGGSYIAILFLIPLLFARYAFILYLDSKKQSYKIMQTLAAALEAKDEYTKGHSKRVEEYAYSIAQSMRMRGKKLDDIKTAAVLHDVGKIGVDNNILNKPAALNDSEWQEMKKHPLIGKTILEDVDLSDEIMNTILYHHVHYSGIGYPNVVDKNEIPLSAYIIGVADAYDAMTSDRPYRDAMSKELACSIIRENRDDQFHPTVVKHFLGLVAQDKI